VTVLVTGASGFLGSAVVRKLLDNDEHVRVMTRKTSDTTNIADLDVEIFYADLRDPASLLNACRGCRSLFHVAADYRLWVRDPSVLYDSNVAGTRNIMHAALEAGIERIVYTSSVATLGLNRDGSPANEQTPVTLENMIGHYKRSKFLAEKVVDDLVRENNLPAVIVNPSTPIGPRDVKPTPTGRIVRDAALGRIPAFVDTGLNIAHVDDVANGHLLAWKNGEIGRRYILGGENLSLQQHHAYAYRVTPFIPSLGYPNGGRVSATDRNRRPLLMDCAWLRRKCFSIQPGRNPSWAIRRDRQMKPYSTPSNGFARQASSRRAE